MEGQQDGQADMVVMLVLQMVMVDEMLVICTRGNHGDDQIAFMFMNFRMIYIIMSLE